MYNNIHQSPVSGSISHGHLISFRRMLMIFFSFSFSFDTCNWLICWCFLLFSRLTAPLNSGPQQMSQNNNAGPHCQIGGSSPLVMPGFPLRSSHSAHTPHYSPYSPSRYAYPFTILPFVYLFWNMFNVYGILFVFKNRNNQIIYEAFVPSNHFQISSIMYSNVP